jgi:membrane protein YqaA with SNARE-associated domain
MPFWPCVLWMAIGKLLRYATITTALLWVPDSFWQAILLKV